MYAIYIILSAHLVMQIASPNEQTVKDILKLYKFYFEKCRRLRVLTFQTLEHTAAINDVNELVLKVISKDYQIPIQIEYFNKNQSWRTKWNLDAIYLIISWDKVALLSICEANKQFLRSARGFFIIFFVAQLSTTDEFNVLEHFWHQFHIINAVAHAPFSENPLNSYKYEPFESKEKLKVYESNARKNRNYFEPIKNFQKHAIKVSMFYRVPTAIQGAPKSLKDNRIYRNLHKLGGYSGVDGMILMELCRKLNFKPVVVMPDTAPYHGVIYKNGTVTGALSLLLARKVALAADQSFIKNYGTDDIEFTTYIDGDIVCIVVPKSQPIPHWMMIFNCFTLSSWACILVTIIMLILLGTLILSRKSKRKPWLDMFAILLSVPTKLLAMNARRIYLLSCLIFSFIFYNTFQGNLVTSYTTTTYNPDISTLEELDKSGLLAYSTLDIFYNQSIMEKLGKKKLYLNQPIKTLNRTAYSRDTFTAERKKDAQLSISAVYLNSNGEKLLYLTKICPLSYILGYIVPRGSTYLSSFNSVIAKLVEGGFAQKWHSDVAYDMIIRTNFKNLVNTSVRAFDLRDVQVAFYILFCGSVVSCLVFAVELLCRDFTFTCFIISVLQRA